MRKLTIILLGLSVILAPACGFAVNFYDGYHAPDGVYLLTYSSLYSADKLSGPRGRTAKNDYDYRKLEELFRLCYYQKDLVLTVMVPFGEARSGFYDVSSRGLGDINLGAGYFLPVKKIDLLPMLFVKLPTGEYDSRKSVNYGTNQYDIKPTFFVYKTMGKLSFDGAAKYFFRGENRSTGVFCGDELHLQGLLGWQFTRLFKAGPSLTWMKSSPQKVSGTKVSASRRESLSAGADFYFSLKPFSLTLTYLRDLRAENTTKGDFFQVKTCHKF